MSKPPLVPLGTRETEARKQAKAPVLFDWPKGPTKPYVFHGQSDKEKAKLRRKITLPKITVKDVP